MNQQQIRSLAIAQLPKYISERYTLGKTIRRNNLRQGQRVVAITKNAASPFVFVAEILGFGSFYDINRDVCLTEQLIPNTPDNQAFYEYTGNPVFQDEDADWDEPEPVFFRRCQSEPADATELEESVRLYDEEMSPVGLSDEGFDAFVYCSPILVARSLRRLKKRYILLQRHSEADNWMSPHFKPLSWFELLPKSVGKG